MMLWHVLVLGQGHCRVLDMHTGDCVQEASTLDAILPVRRGVRYILIESPQFTRWRAYRYFFSRRALEALTEQITPEDACLFWYRKVTFGGCQTVGYVLRDARINEQLGALLAHDPRVLGRVVPGEVFDAWLHEATGPCYFVRRVGNGWWRHTVPGQSPWTETHFIKHEDAAVTQEIAALRARLRLPAPESLKIVSRDISRAGALSFENLAGEAQGGVFDAWRRWFRPWGMRSIVPKGTQAYVLRAAGSGGQLRAGAALSGEKKRAPYSVYKTGAALALFLGAVALGICVILGGEVKKPALEDAHPSPIQETRPLKEIGSPPAEAVARPLPPKFRVNAMVYVDAQHWSVWVNDAHLSAQEPCAGDVCVIAVKPGHVVMSYYGDRYVAVTRRDQVLLAEEAEPDA